MNYYMNNKWVRAAIPALLIHCSIGTVYCWSTFKETIANEIGMSTFSVGWAFSLAIFFLGMSAAFAGKYVEKNISDSSFFSCACFSLGMFGTALSINYLSGVYALIGIYLCYGVLMGIGLGVGYITPVKTIMLWFSDNKGLATGISIMGFGLAKVIATPVMEVLQIKYGIVGMFVILSVIYFLMMYIGHILIQKPNNHIEVLEKNKISVKEFLTNATYIKIWIIFFINIHCGLMLISYEKQLISTVLVGSFMAVSMIPSLTAALNAMGRIGYATASDKLKDRSVIYVIIFASCVIICSITVLGYNFNIAMAVPIIILLLVINAGYGGGFSTLPALLSQKFGMTQVSQIHGLTLTAWAVAGLTGNNTSEIILNLSDANYYYVIFVAMILYIIAGIVAISLVRESTNCEYMENISKY